MVPKQPDIRALRSMIDFLDYVEARSQTFIHSAYVLDRSSAGGTGSRFGVDCVSTKTRQPTWRCGK
jgi:hypothetical protein